MYLHDLLKGLEYSPSRDSNPEITDVVYDSRKVRPGSLFICLSGTQVDSHEFAGKAEEAGAAAIVAEKPVDVKNACVIRVKSTRCAMAWISAAWFHHPAEELTVVGITGTKGKTTTSYMVVPSWRRRASKRG